MKRYGYLYPKIYDMDNLRKAHRNACKGKLFYSEVKVVNSDPEYYLARLHQMLKHKTFTTSEYVVFTRDDRGKQREIYKLPYHPDRIVHWAIVQVLEPIWMSVFIRDTFSSIKGRGIHDGLRRLHHAMRDREATRYCLKFDVKKFYPSIDHDILKQVLRRKIKDPDTLWLLDDIVDSVTGGKGVPIGNYLSQYFGNLYLTGLDHWLKERKWVKYYFRYCDDGVILHHDKQFLHCLRQEIGEYLEKHLKLTLKRNHQTFPTYVRGVDFLGYRSFGDYTLLRKSTAKRFKRKMQQLSKQTDLTDGDVCSIMSYRGWLRWCDGYNLERRYIEPLLGRE